MPSPLKAPFAPDVLRAVADTFGTPTYVYHAPTIRDRIGRLRRHLTGVPVRLLYAMKANSHPAILQIMREEGLGFDAVSPGELLLALRLGVEPDRILFSANNMTDEEMHLAHEHGVLLNIGELSRLEKFGRAYPGSAVCVRLNPQVGAGHHEHVVTAGARSKFGIPVEQTDRIRALADAHGLRIVGLHHHIGSGILHTAHFWEAARVLLEAARPFEGLRFINLGGGLGIPYRPDEAPLDLDNFRDALMAPLRSFHAEYGAPALTFWFEPGRYLVGEAGVLLVRVNTLKSANGRTFAGTDSGMGHLVRPAMYGAYHALYNLSNPDGALQPYDVTGNICESGDLFARDRPVQTIREGDILAILDAGAYGMSMASEYNLRPLPAEVLVTEDGPRLIRARRTPEELADALLTTLPRT
ncbi:diaminopimelate decarboxylase [Rhodothermaceae bacterium RA]|nr:diaminopimelate decarboxylase [Rhodothermaceae bacterium RA]